jgi:hypothetical protein
MKPLKAPRFATLSPAAKPFWPKAVNPAAVERAAERAFAKGLLRSLRGEAVLSKEEEKRAALARISFGLPKPAKAAIKGFVRSRVFPTQAETNRQALRLLFSTLGRRWPWGD